MKKLLLLTALVLPSVAVAGNVQVSPVAGGAVHRSAVPYYDDGAIAYNTAAPEVDEEFIQVKVFSAKDFIPYEVNTASSYSFGAVADDNPSWKLDCLSIAHPMAACKIASGQTNVKAYRNSRGIMHEEIFRPLRERTLQELIVTRTTIKVTTSDSALISETPADEKVVSETKIKKQVKKPAHKKTPDIKVKVKKASVVQKVSEPKKDEALLDKAPVAAVVAGADKSKLKPAAKKKVSLKKRVAAVKRPDQRPTISFKPDFSAVSKTAKLDKKPVVKQAPQISLDEQLYLATSKVLAGANTKVRVSGLNDLKMIAAKYPSAQERIAHYLTVFLTDRANFAHSKVFAAIPKEDIEGALYVLSSLKLEKGKVALRNLDFSGIKLKNTALKNIDFSDSAFVDAVFENVDFSNSSFVGADFCNASFTKVDFTGADLRASYFADTVIKDTDFKSASMGCSVFKSAKITSSRFDKAILTSAWFSGADIVDSSFSEANLSRSDFSKTILKNDDFAKSDFTDANIMGSLQKAVSFDGAKFDGLFVRGADFGDAEGVSAEMILNTVFDDKTKVPSNVAEVFAKMFPKETEVCTPTESVCLEKLAGMRGNLDDLLRASLAVLQHKSSSAGNRNWAICNIGCIVNEDAETYGKQALKALSAFVKKQSPWPPRSNYQTALRTLPKDVGAALYVIGHRPDVLKGVQVDLTFADLRNFEFFGYDMTGVDFSGSNLSGSLVSNAQGMPKNISSTISSHK